MPMIVRRELSAERINAVLNHPDVRPDVAPPKAGVIDVSDGVANRNNILLMGEWGGCLFVKMMPGMYEVHTQVLGEGRGAWARDMTEACADWMFSRSDAFEIVTRIPKHHVGARALAMATGMRLEMRIPDATVWREKRQAIDIYGFRIQDWFSNAGQEFEDGGREFHAFMHKEAERLGITEPPHEDLPLHNKYLGIAVEMITHEQVHKAINCFNRSCVLMRRPVVQLLNLDPIAVRFDIGILKYEGGRFSIERHQ